MKFFQSFQFVGSVFLFDTGAGQGGTALVDGVLVVRGINTQQGVTFREATASDQCRGHPQHPAGDLRYELAFGARLHGTLGSNNEVFVLFLCQHGTDGGGRGGIGLATRRRLHEH